jgi:uncharacterized protein YkwD
VKTAISISIVFFITFVVGGCSLTLFDSQAASSSSVPFPVSQSVMVSTTNQVRQRAGLPPLRWNPQLVEVARRHAIKLAKANKLSHKLGGPLPRRLAATGYMWQAAAENIAYGYNSSAEAMQGWIASRDHLKNLKNPHVTEMGVYAVRQTDGKKRVFWAMILAAPRNQSGAVRAR